MELDRSRRAGVVGIIAALLWLIAWAVLLFIEPAEGSGSWYVTQWIGNAALLATAGFVAGMWQAGVGGPSRLARIALPAWALGWVVLFGGGLVLVATRNEDNPLFPIGGLLTLVAGIASGAAVARAGILAGWRRYAPLAWALFYLVLLVIMVTAEGSWLGAIGELVQYLLILLTAAAVSQHSVDGPAAPEVG